MAEVYIHQRGNVRLGDDHEVHRCHRVDVVERENVLVLVHLFARNLALDDFAENAVFQDAPLYLRSASTRELSVLAAFSSIPEIPSRRLSSYNTSVGRRP